MNAFLCPPLDEPVDGTTFCGRNPEEWKASNPEDFFD